MFLLHSVLSILFLIIISTIKCTNITSRIVGGNFAKRGQFPYQIILQYYNEPICSGSILSSIHVVTAAHCVVWDANNPTAFSIRAGTIIIGGDGVVDQAEKIYVHENYTNLLHDIAVIVLSDPLEFTDKIQLIALDKNFTPPNAKVIISGWGKTSNNGTFATNLKYTTANVLTIQQCKAKNGLAYQEIVCLNHPIGTGACQGDSGGPAVYNGKLIGITSRVSVKCGSEEPDYYVRISFYYNWISYTMSL